MKFTPFDRWLTGSGIRHYKDRDDKTYFLEVGLRSDGHGVHVARNPDAEDEANAILIAHAPQLAIILQEVLLSSELNMDDMEPATIASANQAWRVLNRIFGRKDNDHSLIDMKAK